jgi:hypothetical protein
VALTADLIDDVVAAAQRILALPPAPRSLLEFVRTLRYPDGPEQGNLCDPESHVATFEILRAFAHGGHDEMLTLGPVQDTKTWSTTTVPTMYAIVELRRSVVIGWPDRSLAGKYWRGKLKPTIEASGLGDVLPEEGPGSDGGAPEDVLFRTGARLYLLGAGARNEAGQSMVTAPIVKVEERDSIRARWVELLWQRCESYGEHKRRSSTSTIKHDKGSPTVAVYESSIALRPYFQCPLCVEAKHPSGGWQTLEPDRFRYDATDDIAAESTAHVVCAHVAEHRLHEDLRRWMITGKRWRLVGRGQTIQPDGSVTGDLARSRIWGFRWTALDSPLKPLGELAKQHRQACERRDAHGDHDPLRQFYRDKWVMAYREDVEGQEGTTVVTPAYLQARSVSHGWADFAVDRDDAGKTWGRHLAELPAAATIASLAVDVQLNRCYWSLIGADADLRTWDAAWGYEFASADQVPMSVGELHAVLDRIRELVPSLLKRTDAPDVQLVAQGIDVGFRQHDITAWLAGNPQWTPVSGAGDEVVGKMREAARPDPGAAPQPGDDMLGVVYLRDIQGARLSAGPRQRLHLVDVERVKEQAQSAFLRAAAAAGAAHLPRGLKANDAYILHLTGEVLDEDEKTGKRKWRVIRKRHDYLDLRTYNLALLRLHLRDATLPPTATRRYRVVNGYT